MTDEIEALVERLRRGPFTIGKASGEIAEMRQAADALSSLSARVKELEDGMREIEAFKITNHSGELNGQTKASLMLDIHNVKHVARTLLQKDKA